VNLGVVKEKAFCVAAASATRALQRQWLCCARYPLAQDTITQILCQMRSAMRFQHAHPKTIYTSKNGGRAEHYFQLQETTPNRNTNGWYVELAGQPQTI